MNDVQPAGYLRKNEQWKRISRRSLASLAVSPLGILLLLAFGLTSCAQFPDTLPSVAALPEPQRTELVNESPELSSAPDQTQVQTLAPLSPLSANRLPSTVAQGLKLPAGRLTLNADALPLGRFIHLALTEILGLSIEVDAAVAKRKDPVSLHVSSPVEASRLLGMVEDVLGLYDVGLAPGGAGVRVLPIAKLKDVPPAVFSGDARATPGLGRVMEFIPLNYAAPGEAVTFVRHFLRMGTTGDVAVNQRLNALLVIGDAARVARFRAAVALVDRPDFQGKQLRLIYPVYWRAAELRQVLEKALDAQGVPIANANQRGGMRLVVVEQNNSLLAVSPQKAWVEALLSLVRHLDVPNAVGKGARHFLYFVRNARAKELGEVVTRVLSGQGKVVGVAQEKVAAADDAQQSKGRQAVPTKDRQAVPPDASARENPGSEGMSVIVDEARNALVFVGSADAYHNIRPLLERLDIPTRQVLIEATIAEVSLDDSSQFGIEWQWTDRGAAVIAGNAGLASGYNATLGGGGLVATLVNSASSLRVRLNALASRGRVRVLSSPRLLAMDNETARIQVGDQIAVLTQEVSDATAATANGTGLLRNFNYVDTGVILEVTPTINEGGMVQLKLHQEVSTPGASINNTPPISKRSVDTNLVARTGQTVLIGGLIKHTKTHSRSGVPLLMDVPVVGELFANNSTVDNGRELIVLITPHIINGPDDAAFLTNAFEEQLNWRGEPERLQQQKGQGKAN